MLFIAFMVVAIFIWLVFTNPFKDWVVRDTYDHYLQQAKEQKQNKES